MASAGCILFLMLFVHSQLHPSTLGGHCDCMEYWECAGRGGQPYAYCSSGGQVCCFLNKSGDCGRKAPSAGKEGEWPWHVAVLETPQDLYVCGASLIDEFWVLTAAHCVYEYPSPSLLKVRTGEFDVSSTSERHGHEEHAVARIQIFPAFENRTLRHDIALLRLARRVRRRPHVNVVCMPADGSSGLDFLLSPSCYVTGWGKSTEDGEHSVTLKEVNVPLWRNEDCERALRYHFGPSYKLPATSLCAGAERRDACDGDGGGPLVCEKGGRWYQVGVVSFGIGCGQPNTPGIYTRVESYAPWIHKVVLADRDTSRGWT